MGSGVWYHVAATYSSITDRIRVYLNGSVDGTMNIHSSYTMYNRNCCNNWVGHDNYNGYDFIIPSKDIIKSLSKMKFSLRKLND